MRCSCKAHTAVCCNGSQYYFVFQPDDSGAMRLQGMINHIVEMLDFSLGADLNIEAKAIHCSKPQAIARLITAAENYPEN